MGFLTLAPHPTGVDVPTMPVFCAAYGCKNRRTIESRSRGITFHKFPCDIVLRRQWEVRTRREGFVATEFSKLCSEHFKPEDFDRTGQIVRLRDGATPSVFNFPSHLQRHVATRNTKTSRKAEESLPVDICQQFAENEPQPNDDHSYALPSSPTHLKARLADALDRLEILEREKLNAKARERRAKKMVKSLHEDLKKKTLINKELKERLDFYSEVIASEMSGIQEMSEANGTPAVAVPSRNQSPATLTPPGISLRPATQKGSGQWRRPRRGWWTWTRGYSVKHRNELRFGRGGV